MESRLRILAALLATGAAAACGQSPSTALPDPVAEALAELAAECSDVGGTPHTADAVRRTDVSGDGRDDYLLYAGWIHCENAVSVYGDRMKSLAVFAGEGSGGATPAFADRVFDVEVAGSGREARAWLTVMAEGCGRAPAADFASESFCQRAIEWNAAGGRFEYAPVATVRMIE